jgi:arsenate reductase (glutaredoxin)
MRDRIAGSLLHGISAIRRKKERGKGLQPLQGMIERMCSVPDIMNIQIFGKKKCFDTQKAERYFKERKIKYQYIDLARYGLSKGEFQSVKAAVGLKELIDTGVREYGELHMDRLGTGSNAEDALFRNPSLYRSPVVRNGKQATVGYRPDVWNDWK